MKATLVSKFASLIRLSIFLTAASYLGHSLAGADPLLGTVSVPTPVPSPCAAIIIENAPKNHFTRSFEERFEAHALKVDALETVAYMSDLEQKIARLRNSSGGLERRTETDMRLRLHRLNVEISDARDSNAAVDLYRNLFRDVELAYWTLRHGEQEALSLAQEPQDSNPERVKMIHAWLEDNEREMQLARVKLAEGYGEYRLVRAYLEKAVKDEAVNPDEVIQQNGPELLTARSMSRPQGPTSKEIAKKALDNLGIHNIKTMFPELKLSNARVSLDALKDYFRSHTELTIKKLEKDLAVEKQINRWKAGYYLRRGMQRNLNILPASISLRRLGLEIPIRQPISELLSLSTDEYLLVEYLPKINKVLVSIDSDDNAARLNRLMDLASGRRGDEMLVTFAAISYFQKPWLALKAEAHKREADSELYKNFVVRMKAAEVEAGKLGGLSIYNRVTTRAQIKALLATLAGGSTVATYQLIQHYPTVFEYIRSLKDLAWAWATNNP
jgi:hypothetical protein